MLLYVSNRNLKSNLESRFLRLGRSKRTCCVYNRNSKLKLTCDNVTKPNSAVSLTKYFAIKFIFQIKVTTVGMPAAGEQVFRQAECDGMVLEQKTATWIFYVGQS